MKKFLKIFGGIVFAVILLLLAIPLFISADTLKKQFVEQASKATGRTVDIKGKTSLTLFPDIAVSAEDVTIGNPAGFRSPYLVHAKTLATGAALMPLLHGNLNVTGITIDSADINLEQLASGAKNWEFAKEKAAESADKNAKSSSPLKSFALGDVDIKDSSVKMIKPAKTTALDQINLTVKGADARANLKVDGSARYQGKTVKLTADIDRLRDFLNEKASPVTADIDLPGGNVKFDGKAQMGDVIVGAGKLALDMSDLPGLMQWSSGKPAKGIPKSINLKADVSVNGQKYALKNTSLKVDDLTANGDLAANLEGAVPAVNGTLKFGTLDINKLLNIASNDNAPGFMDAYAAESKGWSREPLDLSALRSVNADISITADKLLKDKVEVSNIAIHPQLSGGNLNLGINKASLYGGTATGTITANASGAVGSNLNFAGIQIEPFLTALTGSSRLKGTTALQLNVHGAGGSQYAIVSSLDGNGSLKVTDGAIKGVNLAEFWREARKGFLFNSDSKSTDFSELSGTFTIANGIVSNNDLTMKSPFLRVAGKGTANLPAQTLNYRLTPTVTSNIKGQGGKDVSGLDIPLDITGPLASPSVTPDVSGMLQQQLQNPEALKNTLKDVKGTIKQYNSPSDIGKALFGGSKTQVPAATAPAPAPAPTTNAAPAPTTAPQPAPVPAPQKPEDQLNNLLKGF